MLAPKARTFRGHRKGQRTVRQLPPASSPTSCASSPPDPASAPCPAQCCRRHTCATLAAKARTFRGRHKGPWRTGPVCRIPPASPSASCPSSSPARASAPCPACCCHRHACATLAAKAQTFRGRHKFPWRMGRRRAGGRTARPLPPASPCSSCPSGSPAPGSAPCLSQCGHRHTCATLPAKARTLRGQRKGRRRHPGQRTVHPLSPASPCSSSPTSSPIPASDP